MNQASKQDLRQILGKFITGVTVVTTLDHNQAPVGFTANSFTSVSLDPPLVLVCLAKSAGLASVFRRANAFAINILASDQATISNAFATKDEDRFAGIAWQAKQTGSPIIKNCAAWLDCEMYEKIAAGDHVMLIGQIKQAEKSNDHPLAYYQGRYCEIDLPEETLSQLEHRESVHSSTGILLDLDDKLLFIKQADGTYDVPRTAPSSDISESSIEKTMACLGIPIRNKALFSVVEGRHHQRLAIYYRCRAEQVNALPKDAVLFALDDLPLKQLSRGDLAGVLKRYAVEKNSGQFGIYVGDGQQGHLEQSAERKI